MVQFTATVAVAETDLFELLRSNVLPSEFKKALDEGRSPDQLSMDNQTPLHQAALLGLEAISQQLLESGASPDIADDGLQTPLHYAVIGGHDGIVQKLIDAKTNLNAQDLFGNSPLDLARMQGLDGIANLLQVAGAISGQEYFQLWSGCEPVNLNVLGLSDKAADVGLTNAQIEALAWYHLLSNNLFDGEIQNSVLRVLVNIDGSRETGFGFVVNVQYMREVVDVSSQITKLAVTWEDIRLGAGNPENVRDKALGSLLSSMEQFTAEYLQANQDFCTTLPNRETPNRGQDDDGP